MKPIVRVENLSKQYRIGAQETSYGTLRESIVDALRSPLDRLQGKNGKRTAETIWALKNVSFDVTPGEVVGVIGRNGAGKSTLLKVLSRITEPTTGRVELYGRVASLLEVGTGFHQELTGRENIFLNGAILGMTRREVLARFDEIVDFSGVERFIDTPVKRYSVGMYARLAFSVAAHLETEILFVDEVLAVGDAEFQKRCLDRMSAVASAGRTVLFVSHNLAAVAALTKRGIVLKGGKLLFDGPIDTAIAQYSASLSKGKVARDWGRGHHSAIISADLLDAQGLPTDIYEPGTPFNLQVEVETTNMPGLGLELQLRDANNLPVGFYSSSIFSQMAMPSQPGRHVCTLSLQPLFLASGDYSFDISTNSLTIVVDHMVSNAIPFRVAASSPGGIAYDFKQSLGNGVMAMQLASPLRIEPKAPEPA